MEIQETFINESKGYLIGETDWYEPYTDDKRRLFRGMQREYGGCTGKAYRDTPRGMVAVGWVFSRWEDYEDCHRFGRIECGSKAYHREHHQYVREVWVTFRDSADVHVLDLVTV